MFWLQENLILIVSSGLWSVQVGGQKLDTNIEIGPGLSINIAQCIANSIFQVARKLESHCTLQILNK